MAYALPRWTKSTSNKPRNHPPSSPESSSELPHKVLWEVCVIISVGCFLTIVSIQMMSRFARLLHALSCHWLNVTPRSVRIRLRFTGLVIVGNMILRSFLTSGWEYVLLIPVLIHVICTFGTKLAVSYFESTVREFQNLSIFLALHEAGYPVCTTANLPPPPPLSPSPPPPPSPATLQPTPPPARCSSSPAVLLRQQLAVAPPPTAP